MSGCPNIVSRSEWQARPPKQTTKSMQGPAQYVFIHHSAGAFASDCASAKQQVRIFQNYHMDDKKYDDIGYSFVVGEDGNVYEGRGWTGIGAHTLNYNDIAIGICVIGKFDASTPNDAAVTCVKNLIQYGVDHGHIIRNYTLKGHRDVRATDCPGNQLYALIQSWPHYVGGNKKY